MSPEEKEKRDKFYKDCYEKLKQDYISIEGSYIIGDTEEDHNRIINELVRLLDKFNEGRPDKKTVDEFKFIYNNLLLKLHPHILKNKEDVNHGLVKMIIENLNRKEKGLCILSFLEKVLNNAIYLSNPVNQQLDHLLSEDFLRSVLESLQSGEYAQGPQEEYDTTENEISQEQPKSLIDEIEKKKNGKK